MECTDFDPLQTIEFQKKKFSVRWIYPMHPRLIHDWPEQLLGVVAQNVPTRPPWPIEFQTRSCQYRRWIGPVHPRLTITVLFAYFIYLFTYLFIFIFLFFADVHLVRNYDVRLVGAGSSFEGRVEIFRVGQWGTICSDEWDHKDADVVCRQLGYSGAEAVPAVTHYGLGKGQIWLDDLQCRGNETNLGQCAHGGWAQHNCNHSQDAGVRCSKGRSKRQLRTATDSLETTAAAAAAAAATTTTDSDNHRHYTVNTTATIMISSSSSSSSSSPSPSPSSSSSSSSSSLSSSSNHYHHPSLPTAGSTKPVRLVDRNNTHGGRVEIYHQNRWGSICFDGWDVHDAFVVCRTVGYGGAKGIKSYSRKDSPLWLQNARCRGNEDSLGDCPNSGWNWGSSCSYGYAGVLCNGECRSLLPSDGFIVWCSMDYYHLR